MSLFPADDIRLRELILYLAFRCEDWEGFDPAMLERMLFQSDFLHFRLHGFPITGHAYRRGVLSPGPRSMGRILREMTAKGELRIMEEGHPDGVHARRIPRAFREPDLRIFDGQEIAMVERVIRFYRANAKRCRENAGPGHSGSDLLSLPWELAAPREEVPYPLALLGTLSENGSRSDLQSVPRQEMEAAREMRMLAHHSLILAS